MTLRQAFKLIRLGFRRDVRGDRLDRAFRRCTKYGAYTKARAPWSEAKPLHPPESCGPPSVALADDGDGDGA